MANRTVPLDYTLLVFERGDTCWSLLARERKAHKLWAIAMRFRDSRPADSYGRFLFGACDRDMPDAELRQSVSQLPAPEWPASH